MQTTQTEQIKLTEDKRLQVAVFFGGCSPEYLVSLTSAAAVITHLDRQRFVPVLIGISRQGQWYYYTGEVNRIAQDTWCEPRFCRSAVLQPGSRQLLVFGADGVQVEQTIALDVAFPVLHGKNGEDGTVQGFLQLAGVPLAGCGVLSAALCMDKWRAHQLAAADGIAIPAAVLLQKEDKLADKQTEIDALGYPLFVKPVRAGSSYGISKVANKGQLAEAIAAARQYDDTVLLEEAVDGFEVGCAVMGNQILTVGEVDEIELNGGFFDFSEKYTLQNSAIHVPARISAEKAAEVKATARQIYHILGCSGFARVDLFLTPEGALLFNEVNTIPGFTAHSRFPNMMKAAGFSFTELLTEILEQAV